MRGILTQVLVAFVLAAGAKAGSPSDAPIKAPQNESTTAKSRTADKMQSKAKRSSRPYQVGEASWYGRPFHGRKTASGEPFDMYQLTAAHRNLPLGSWVKVTNLKNHRWVLVRINDRGPVPKDRIIDLSYSAARMLDMKARGIGRVRLDLVDGEPSAETLAMAKSPARF
jgi:peptidoglycan lytic transglycosylase